MMEGICSSETTALTRANPEGDILQHVRTLSHFSLVWLSGYFLEVPTKALHSNRHPRHEMHHFRSTSPHAIIITESNSNRCFLEPHDISVEFQNGPHLGTPSVLAIFVREIFQPQTRAENDNSERVY
jgi:hypothetical protein